MSWRIFGDGRVCLEISQEDLHELIVYHDKFNNEKKE